VYGEGKEDSLGVGETMRRHLEEGRVKEEVSGGRRVTLRRCLEKGKVEVRRVTVRRRCLDEERVTVRCLDEWGWLWGGVWMRRVWHWEGVRMMRG
jgi:hypothetical protein